MLDGDRTDLDAYLAIAEELTARRVVDIGCGTGCLAVRMAEIGLEVIGVDPAAASLQIARAKPFADRVTWVDGDATDLADRQPAADLAVMTGNVAPRSVTGSGGTSSRRRSTSRAVSPWSCRGR